MKFYKCKTRSCKTCCVGLVTDETLPIGFIPFWKLKNVIYKINCLTWGLSYVGQTSNELHIRINLHRSNIKNFKKASFSSVEIAHFNLHSFENISLEILNIVDGLDERLYFENDFIFLYRTLYPYGLNSSLNNIILTDIDNVYSFLNFINKFQFDNVKYVKRGCRGSHVNAYKNKFIIPHIFVDALEREFTSSFNITKIKAAIFSLKHKILKKLLIIFPTIKFNSTFFKDLLLDLLNFKVKNFSASSFDKNYFTLTFQQKSFDFFRPAKMFSKFSSTFPIKNIQMNEM